MIMLCFLFNLGSLQEDNYPSGVECCVFVFVFVVVVFVVVFFVFVFSSYGI